MTKLLTELNSIAGLIQKQHIKSVSFDIDGTLYPIRKVQLAWWLSLLSRPLQARRFYHIKLNWEGRRQGDSAVAVTKEDVHFFENFLVSLLHADLVSSEMRDFLRTLKAQGIELFFLSDHGAELKLRQLELAALGTAINCLVQTGELKPHPKISQLLKTQYHIHAEEHLHIGDRWSDEAQARDMGCSFIKFICPLY